MAEERQGVSYAGDFEVVHAMISSKNGQVRADLLTDVQITELNIFENMFRSAVTGSILITDTREVITKFPFMGQEILTLKVVTPSPLLKSNKLDVFDFTETRFVINKVAVRTQIGSGAQLYDLSFVSEHAVINNRKRLSRSFVKSKSNIGEMVKELLQSELGIPEDKTFVEDTLGSRSLIVPNLNPHTFINLVGQEAISKKSGSPHYVFFENKNGVHFRSIQDLYEQDLRGLFQAGDKGTDEEYFGGDVDSGKIVQSYRRILQYSLNTRNDLMLNSQSGMIGGKVIEHNLYRKRLDTKTFNYFNDDDYYKFFRIEGGASERGYTDIFDDAPDDELENTRVSVIPISKNKSEHDMYFELQKTPNKKIETINERQSRFTELSNGISLKLTVHGYTGLAVGDMIRVFLPTIGGDDNDGIFNELFSGDYLISTLRHTFALPIGTHAITMDVVKDGLKNTVQLPSVLGTGAR